MAPVAVRLRVPILRGRLRGTWWLPLAGGKTARVLWSTYEPAQTRLFEKLICPGDAIFDVGAHVGYYTLLSSRLVGTEGRVYSFEPNPENARYLRRHCAVNRCGNVSITEAAASDRGGTARFRFGTGSGTGRLAEEGEEGVVSVASLRLDDFAAERALAPSAIKIDVEGAEASVLRGALRILEEARPVIFLSTHGPEVHAECLSLLRSLDYGAEAVGGGDPERAPELLCRPSEGRPSHADTSPSSEERAAAAAVAPEGANGSRPIDERT